MGVAAALIEAVESLQPDLVKRRGIGALRTHDDSVVVDLAEFGTVERDEPSIAVRQQGLPAVLLDRHGNGKNIEEVGDDLVAHLLGAVLIDKHKEVEPQFVQAQSQSQGIEPKR